MKDDYEPHDDDKNAQNRFCRVIKARLVDQAADSSQPHDLQNRNQLQKLDMFENWDVLKWHT